MVAGTILVKKVVAGTISVNKSAQKRSRSHFSPKTRCLPSTQIKSEVCRCVGLRYLAGVVACELYGVGGGRGSEARDGDRNRQCEVREHVTFRAHREPRTHANETFYGGSSGCSLSGDRFMCERGKLCRPVTGKEAPIFGGSYHRVGGDAIERWRVGRGSNVGNREHTRAVGVRRRGDGGPLVRRRIPVAQRGGGEYLAR